MCGLPFTVTCPSADVTVRCCTARLHPLSARNLETNVTDSVNIIVCFAFTSFTSMHFCFFSFASRLPRHVSAAVWLSVPSVTDDRRVSLSRLSDTDGTGRLAIFTVPSGLSLSSCFRETGENSNGLYQMEHQIKLLTSYIKAFKHDRIILNARP